LQLNGLKAQNNLA